MFGLILVRFAKAHLTESMDISHNILFCFESLTAYPEMCSDAMNGRANIGHRP